MFDISSKAFVVFKSFEVPVETAFVEGLGWGQLANRIRVALVAHMTKIAAAILLGHCSAVLVVVADSCYFLSMKHQSHKVYILRIVSCNVGIDCK